MKQILLHIIYLVVVFGGGFVTSFLVDAPTKRALAKLRVLIAREEAEFSRTKNLLIGSVKDSDQSFLAGLRKMLDNFQRHVDRLEGK